MSVTPASDTLVSLGETTTLSAAAANSDGGAIAGKTFAWSSSNETVASVSATGTVTAVSNGSATITATVDNVSGTASILVRQDPAGLAVEAGDAQTADAGTAVATAPSVKVSDARGNGVQSVSVTFEVVSGGGMVVPTTPVTTNSSGIAAVTSWTLGTSAGTNTLTANASGLTGSLVTFSATGVASIAINNGDGQTILAGATAVIPPSVLVLGAPVQGATVDFTVTTGAGTIDGGANTSVLTDASGIATANTWVFDAAAGTNVITATVTGVGSVIFTGTGVAAGGYDIDVRILTTPTAAQQTAFDNAEARWENLVVSELSDGAVTTPADFCGITHPALNETVDDLLILVRLEVIDGVGGALGGAGPCLVRTGTVLTGVGVMLLDIDDLAALEADGQLEDVILHLMGHVIGIGTFWDTAGFLQNPSLDADGNPIAGQDTHFNGNHAVVAFEDRLGGSSYTGGASVPVENGSGGTRDVHWRESVFVAELMTGVLDLGVPNPLSLLTIASLADHGYAVNPDGADTYSQVFTVLGASYARISLGDDIWRGPLYTVSPTGVIRRVR